MPAFPIRSKNSKLLHWHIPDGPYGNYQGLNICPWSQRLSLLYTSSLLFMFLGSAVFQCAVWHFQSSQKSQFHTAQIYSRLRSNGFWTGYLPQFRQDCLSAPRPSDHGFMPSWASIHFVTNFCSTCQLDHSNGILWLMSTNQITAKLSLIISGVNMPTGT